MGLFVHSAPNIKLAEIDLWWVFFYHSIHILIFTSVFWMHELNRIICLCNFSLFYMFNVWEYWLRKQIRNKKNHIFTMYQITEYMIYWFPLLRRQISHFRVKRLGLHGKKELTQVCKYCLIIKYFMIYRQTYVLNITISSLKKQNPCLI